MDKLTEQPIKKKIRNFITLNSVTKDEIRQEYNEIFDKLKEYEDKQEWISVEDRLPKPNEEVLVCDEYGEIYLSFFLKSCGNFAGVEQITHWSPLPAKPKMKGAE